MDYLIRVFVLLYLIGGSTAAYGGTKMQALYS